MPPPPPFDPAELWRRVDGDRDLLASLVELYREDAPRLLAQVAGALAADDCAALESAAHALKGATAVLAAGAAGALLGQLERQGRAGELAAARATHGLLALEVERLLSALDELLAR